MLTTVSNCNDRLWQLLDFSAFLHVLTPTSLGGFGYMISHRQGSGSPALWPQCLIALCTNSLPLVLSVFWFVGHSQCLVLQHQRFVWAAEGMFLAFFGAFFGREVLSWQIIGSIHNRPESVFCFASSCHISFELREQIKDPILGILARVDMIGSIL